MICPKCKTEVSPDDTVCPHCKLRLMFKCPRCGSPARLGSVSCSKCGYTFVKFCPKCHSANYASSSVCRKCGMEFENEKIELSQNPDSLISRLKIQPKPIMMQNSSIDEPRKVRKLNIPLDDTPESSTEQEETQTLQQIQAEINEVQEQISKEEPQSSQDNSDELLFLIDFINLERTFEKFNKEEFTQKVVQNIKTTVKITFGVTCEFISPSVVSFTYNCGKKTKIQDKTAQFEQEFEKFNKILEKTLDCGLSYKFAITTLDDIKKGADLTQLKYGSDKDVIVSASAYPKLSASLSLIKISSDSYKMIFLDQKPVFEQSEYVKYDKALETIFNNLADNNAPIRAISVNAPRGAGKTHLLNNLYYRANKAKTNNTVLFYAQCSALTQISAYGLIQSFFISLFDCPNVLNSEFNLKAFERVVLDKFELEKIDKETLSTLANLIYPMDKSYYENILISKEITHRYLKDIFNYIKNKKNVIFIIDDFDLIDESSYSFLKYLVDEDYFARDAKLILGYKNPHSIAMYFQTTKLNNNNCLNISLKTLNMAESKTFIKKVIGDDAQIPPEIMSQIAYNAQGNIAYIEQILQYMFERKILNVHNKVVTFKNDDVDIELPSTLENCFEERLEFLKEQSEDEYIFLNTASLLGDKPDYRVLSRIFELSENDYFDIVQRLEKKGYLKRKFDDVYGFKNSLTWSYCYIKAKEEELIKDKAHKMLVELNGKIISTPLICPILAQIIGNKELAFSLWTKNLQYASFIGDINIYAMAQKQSLILLESVKTDKLDYIKNNICERLGKLIYAKNPQEARNYLANAIVSAQKTEEINKIIDLSGFLVKSAYLTQDFTGVVEVIDNVLKYFDTEDKTEKRSSIELQIALIKAKKLQALLELGSWEEISNIVNTEINPILQRNLHSFSNHKWIDKEDIFYIWIEANIILVKSYCIQGSPMAFELISEINKVLSPKKGSAIEQLRVSLSYAEAMANTSKGNFSESDAILKDIVKDYSYAIDNPAFVCEWNIISIINKILRMDYTSIKEELFEATAYANNCNNEVSKNLLKTLLAYVMLNEKSYLKAIEISTKQMQYFSSKKIAFGALLSWYISAAATSYNKADMYCIEICEKAVKICENAQNNNFWFKILFQELLAKTYLKLNDKENATMYCDLALQSANANDLAYLQVRLNNLKANIAREKLGEQQEDKKREYAKNVARIYTRTLDLAKFLNLPNHVKKIEKEITSFRAHCQLNRIIEDK